MLAKFAWNNVWCRRLTAYLVGWGMAMGIGARLTWIWLSALWVLTSVPFVCQAVAAPADLSAVLAGTRQRIETSDFRATGKLIQVGAGGERTSYKITMKGHWFPDGLRLLCEITEPAAARTRLLLHMNASGHVTIQVVEPGKKVPVVLPLEHWSDPLLGTGFSYEDMVEDHLFWKGQGLLAPAKYGARDCDVLKSTLGTEDRSSYGSVSSWIDQTIFYPVHVVKTVRGTGQQKDFVAFGLRQNSGVWSASQIEVKVQGKPGSSLLVIDSGTEKAKLGRKDFDLNENVAEGEK
jgi:hypothetical protein